MSAALLLLTSVLTGGSRPYWAVLAFVSVLAPSAAKTRESALETVVASVAAALGFDQALALQLRLAEYVVGAVLGAAAAIVADYLGRCLWRARLPESQPDLAG